MAHYSLDQWLEQNKVVDPGDIRTHVLDGAVAIPGLYANDNDLSDAHAENLVIGKTGGVQIHIKPDGTINLGSESPGDAVGLASLVKAELDGIKGDLDSIKSTMNSHTHTHPMGPTGPLVVPLVLTYSPTEPKSTVVLSD